MSSLAQSHSKRSLFGRLPLRTVLIAPFVLQVLLIVGLVGYLSFRSGQRAVLDLATQLRQELTERIDGELRAYFQIPPSLTQINAAAFVRGTLDFDQARNVYLFQQELSLSPYIAGIYCSSKTGAHLGVGYDQPSDPAPHIWWVPAGTNAQPRHSFRLDAQGYRHEAVLEYTPYDPRKRTWYQQAVQLGKPGWSDVFLDFKSLRPTVPAVRPVYNETTGELLGVCAVNVNLTDDLRHFLASLTIGKTGKAYIMDRTGVLFSSSGSELLTVGKGEKMKMLQAAASSELLVRETTRFLQSQPGGLVGIDQPRQLDFQLGGERQFVQAAPFQDHYGLDWLIVITVPERDFMERINANTRNTLLLSLAALLAAIGVGVFTARWITRPILGIANASGALAQGDLDQQVQPSPVNELGRLGNAFNSMAQQLKQAFANIQVSEKKFRSLYEDSKDAIFIAKADGALLDLNPAGQTLFGLRADEIESFNTQDLYINPADRDQFRQEIEQNGAVADFAVKMQKRDGSQFDALVTATLRHGEDGTPIGYQGIIRDITVQKQNEHLRAENLRMGTELEVTQRLQQMILPKTQELQAIEGLEIAGFMEPADEVGGDYYDVLHHNGHVKIGIGDVTGHGLESGMLMLMTQMGVRTLLTNGEQDAKRFLTSLNRTLYDNAQRIGTLRTLSLSLLDYHAGQLTLSGHHEELIVVRRARETEWEIERIDTFELGFAIGMQDDINDLVGQMTIELQPGDGVVLYTDGITEAINTAHAEYGLERLCAVIQQHWAAPAELIKQAIIADLRQHIGQQVVFDDITVVVIKQK
jgi:sigma-B regulation protein RsbU (phosphoserine phosphatase)